MNQEIKYSGFSAVPSDYECPDGSLAVSINLLPEDGALKPVLPPSVMFSLEGNDKLRFLCVHHTSVDTHYIVVRTSKNAVYYTNGDTSNAFSALKHIHNFPEGVTIFSCQSVGYTLIFLTSSGLYYVLWKSNENKYLDLGSHLPECPLSFGLQGEMVRTDEFSVNFDSIGENDIWTEFSEINKNRITDQVLAKVNKFIAEQSVDKGRFIFPFFVRYAYRLFDGSLVMHSAPVLMVASSDVSPQVFWNHISGKDSFTDATLRVAAMAHRLDYAVVDQKYITQLLNWKDIVRSVDIFISKPIYTYDQNGKCERFAKSADIDSYCVALHVNQAVPSITYPTRYQRHTFNKLYAFTFDPDTLSYPTGRLILPRRSPDAVKQDIKACSQFYLLSSVNLDALTTKRTVIDIKDDYLQSLLAREVMTDDYDSHDTVIPQYAYSYNNRINVANIKKILFSGYHTASQFCYTDGYVDNYNNPKQYDITVAYEVYVHIRQDSKEIVVLAESALLAYMDAPILFIFYPNVNAYKATIVKWYGMPIIYEVPLERHDYLNGAFYFGGWDNPRENTNGNVPFISMDDELEVRLPNKIYTSEVNNPFYFPLLGINTVGTGEIKGICSAAKALSQGQFGQFPLYAFTTEGVWALEVSSTGTYSARQPITRDVCINPDGITQLDSAVLFPTDRGIMLIAGSQTQCISEAINSEYPFDATHLPGFTKLHAMLGHEPSADKCLPTLPFTQFLKKCQMIYDYVHQRVIVYAPSITYAYVYSLKTNQWGMIFSNIASHLNSYPEAIAVDTNNAVLNFSVPKAEQVKCLYTTRPLKLEAANVLKTIDNVIQRGFFRKGNVATALYGSRDLINWHLVWSSKDHYLRGFRGSPYKYFRIAGVATLSADENIFGASVQFTPRQVGQPR